MSRRNGKKHGAAAIHSGKLNRPNASVIEGAEAVRLRLCDVHHLFRRVIGSELTIPRDLERESMRFQNMLKRFQTGDFRFSDSELTSMKAIALWTLDLNATLRNQAPAEVEL